jgi:hypothetical protein
MVHPAKEALSRSSGGRVRRIDQRKHLVRQQLEANHTIDVLASLGGDGVVIFVDWPGPAQS